MKNIMLASILAIILATSSYALRPGTIRIVSPINNYQIFIDDGMLKDNMSAVQVSPGIHNFKVKLNGAILYEANISVKESKTTLVAIPKDVASKSEEPVPVAAPAPASAPALAPTPEAASSVPAFQQKLEYEYMGINYFESDNWQDNGTIYGLAYSMSDKIGDWKVMSSLRYSDGYADFTGPIVSDKRTSAANVPFHSSELSLTGGYDLPLFGTVATPYAGLGMRYISDNLQQALSYGTQRETTYYYAPLGLGLSAPIDNDSSWGMDLEYDAFMGGRVIYPLSDLNQGGNVFEDVEVQQISGSGNRASISYLRKIYGLNLEFKAFTRVWAIPESEPEDLIVNSVTVGEISVPKNNTTESGISISLIF